MPWIRCLMAAACTVLFVGSASAETLATRLMWLQPAVAVSEPVSPEWDTGSPAFNFQSDDHRLLLAQATPAAPDAPAAVDPPQVSTHQDTTVDVRASWLSDFLPVVGSLLMLLLTWAFRFLPGYVLAGMKLFRVDQILQRSIDTAITRVQGAIKGKVWSIDVGNAVVAAALENFLASAPASLIAWAGGKDGLVRKILARVNEYLPAEFGDINPAKVDHKGDPAVVTKPATNFDGNFVK